MPLRATAAGGRRCPQRKLKKTAGKFLPRRLYGVVRKGGNKFGDNTTLPPTFTAVDEKDLFYIHRHTILMLYMRLFEKIRF